MKKLLNCLLAIQLVMILAGCCPCGDKKAQEQNPAQDSQPEAE